MPLLHHPVPGPLGGDRQPEQLARQADGQVADVDHLLDLAEALGADLAGLDRHQRAEVVLVLAQQFAEFADQLAADRRRHVAPRPECVLCLADDRADLVGGVRAQPGELTAGDRGARDQIAVVGEILDAEARQDRRGLGSQVVVGRD